MRVTVVAPPDPVVTLDQAKRHLRVEHDDDDAYITDLIDVATAWLDGPVGWLGRALGEQTLLADFPVGLDAACRNYPCPPFIAVVSETPAADGRTTGVRYRAGYGDVDGKTTVPAPIRHAILLMVGHLYANREAVTGGTAKPEQLPLGVDALLSPYRAWAV